MWTSCSTGRKHSTGGRGFAAGVCGIDEALEPSSRCEEDEAVAAAAPPAHGEAVGGAENAPAADGGLDLEGLRGACDACATSAVRDALCALGLGALLNEVG